MWQCARHCGAQHTMGKTELRVAPAMTSPAETANPSDASSKYRRANVRLCHLRRAGGRRQSHMITAIGLGSRQEEPHPGRRPRDPPSSRSGSAPSAAPASSSPTPKSTSAPRTAPPCPRAAGARSWRAASGSVWRVSRECEPVERALTLRATQLPAGQPPVERRDDPGPARRRSFLATLGDPDVQAGPDNRPPRCPTPSGRSPRRGSC